ncbi:MAG: site-specific DNA-methyltransferase [candidate division WOR-3 bacterium]
MIRQRFLKMKWPQDFINKVIQGDALEVMKQIPDESIDMAITSPPYYGLRDYGIKGQLGLENNPQEHIDKLIAVFRELKRILKKTGSFYLNLGDVYYGSNKRLTSKTKEKLNWLQPKQLMLMPARIAMALQEDGWILRNDIIYHKRNPLPSSVKDRLTNTYEHLFFFVKNRKYFYDLDSIREPHTSIKELGRERLDTKTPKHDLALKQKAGKIAPNGYLVQHSLGKNPGDVIDSDMIQDLIKEVYSRLNRNSKTYKGKNRCKDKNAKVIQVFNGKKIRDTAREILKEKGIDSAELIEYIHDHFSHPLGRNPGDIIIERNDERAVLSKKQGLHTFYSHSRRGVELNNPLGKNPGDVIYTPDGDFVYGSEEYADWFFFKRKKIDWKSEGEKIRYTKGNIKDVEQYPHPLCSNPGDFWTITVKPFREAHFAVYPEELCIKPIKASCPEFVCKKCGKPVIKKIIGTKGFGNSFNIRVRDMQIHPEKWGTLYKASEEEKRKYNEKQYRHTTTRDKIINKCDCNAGFEPGIVLDMFAGSGTTGVVAKKLGRRYILIDLKPEYCKMARKRLKGSSLNFVNK